MYRTRRFPPYYSVQNAFTKTPIFFGTFFYPRKASMVIPFVCRAKRVYLNCVVALRIPIYFFAGRRKGEVGTEVGQSPPLKGVMIEQTQRVELDKRSKSSARTAGRGGKPDVVFSFDRRGIKKNLHRGSTVHARDRKNPSRGLAAAFFSLRDRSIRTLFVRPPPPPPVQRPRARDTPFSRYL